MAATSNSSSRLESAKRAVSDPLARQLLHALEQSSRVVLVCDAAFNVLWANSAGYDFLEPTGGAGLRQRVDDAQQEQNLDRVSIAAQRMGCAVAELCFRTSDGVSMRWLQAEFVALEDYPGSLARYVIHALDITEQRRSTEALRASEARFRHLADNAPVMLWVTAADGRCVFLSRTWYEFTGQTPETALGLGWLDAVHPEDRAFSSDTFQRANRDARPFQLDYRFRRRDGVYRWGIDAAVPQFAEDGSFLGYVGSVIDITERKLAEQQLTDASERLALAQRAGRAGMFDWDLVTGNVMWSPELEALYGLPAGSFGRTAEAWAACVVPEDASIVFDLVRQKLQGGAHEIDYEFRVILPDGSRRWLAGAARFVYGSEGKPVRMIGINFDIDERKRAEEALRIADRRKDEFLAILAHELRNPLAPMRNALELMRVAGDTRQTVEQARTLMERQLQHMVRLIDDLLDLSRISRGAIPLIVEPVALQPVLDNAVETGRPLIDEAEHELTVRTCAEPVYVNADATRLAQVFANLLNNAAKYTPHGGKIWLELRRDGSEAIVSVRDNGIGIAADLLPRVFDMFTQGDTPQAGTRGGLGIGLNVVKQVVQKHMGTVTAHSAGAGQGSEFIVRLPTIATPAQAATSPAEPAKAAATGTLRVVVADDNEDSASSLAMLLELLGHDVRTASDGSQAVHAASEFQPDVVLLDIGMPVMDGHEACQTIRALPGGERMVIVALTGWGQAEDKERSKAAGFDRHFVKPVDPTQVQRLLAEAPAILAARATSAT